MSDQHRPYYPQLAQRIEHLVSLHPDLMALLRQALPTSTSNGAVLAAVQAGVETVLERINEMSGSLSDRIDAATGSLETDVANVTAEVASLKASMTPGSQVTEAQVARVEAIHTALSSLNPATPVTIPAPAAA